MSGDAVSEWKAAYNCGHVFLCSDMNRELHTGLYILHISFRFVGPVGVGRSMNGGGTGQERNQLLFQLYAQRFGAARVSDLGFEQAKGRTS